MPHLPDLGPGDLIFVGDSASVQFKMYPFVARIIACQPSLTAWDGWQWLRVYETRAGVAIGEREIYVRTAGVVRIKRANVDASGPPASTALARRSRNGRRRRPSTPDTGRVRAAHNAGP